VYRRKALSVKIMNIIYNNIFVILLPISILFLDGCGTFSWTNPNLGEKSTDGLLRDKKYEQALEKLNRHNDAPWAQYRLGLLYEMGNGVSQDYQKALYWYLKASVQMSDDDWSKGKGSYGKPGFYNQNCNAYNSQIRIGGMYYNGMGTEKDPVEAYLWINYALRNAEKDYTSPNHMLNHENFIKLKNSLSEEQKHLIEIRQKAWEPAKTDIYKKIILDKIN